MRDRLGHLQEMQKDSDGFSMVELEAPSAAFHPDEELDRVLQEAQQISVEIQQIQNDISELKDVNHQALNKTSFPSAVTRDSNAIGADIKHRGEAVLQRLHMLNALSVEVETQQGGTDSAARIARTQYQCLSRTLQEAMFSYNDAEMSHREACRRQIQRHVEVVGGEVSEEQLEEMMETGQWNVFSVQFEGKTAQSALVQIESRQRELLDLENRIQEVQELFLDVALLVEEHGVAAQNIQINVQNCEGAIQQVKVELDRATASDKNNPFKIMCCSCFPCYKN